MRRMVEPVIAKVADYAAGVANATVSSIIIAIAMVVQSVMIAFVRSAASSVTRARLVADVAMVHAMDGTTARSVHVSEMKRVKIISKLGTTVSSLLVTSL